MSERVHFKLAFGGETHRFASILVGDELLDAVRTKVVSVVGDDKVEMYWIDDDSHVVLSSSEDLQTAIEYARFTRTNPAKPPCVVLAVRGAAVAEKQPAAAPVKTESECSRANCTASFPSQGFIDYNAATWRCALCNQHNVVPPSYYEGPQLYFAMSRLETEEVPADDTMEQWKADEEAVMLEELLKKCSQDNDTEFSALEILKQKLERPMPEADDVDDDEDVDDESVDETDEDEEEESEEECEAEEQQHTVQHDGGFSRLPYSDEEEEETSEEESSEEESEEDEELETAIENSTSEEEEESEEESESEEASSFEQVEEQEEASIKSDEGSWTLEEHPAASPVAAPAAESIWRRLLPAGPGSMNVPVGLGVAAKGQPLQVPVDVRRELDKSCRLAETSTPEFNAAYNIRQGLSEEEKERLEKESEQAAARARMEFQKRFENSVWTGPAATVQLQPTAQEQLEARECALAEKEEAFERRVASFAVEIEEFEERIRLLEKRVGRVEKGKDGEMEMRMDEVEERLSKIEM